MSKTRLTIFMPSYNKEAYIAEAIESVIMQKTNFNVELLIIDDNSTDKSLKIAQDYQNKYPKKIRILVNEKNEGCLRTTVKGYELIKTEYFCVLDSDDYWINEKKLQKAVDFLDNNPTFTMYIANTYIEEGSTRTPYFVSASKDFDFQDLNQAIWGHTSGVIFRNIIFKHGVPEKLYKQLGTKNERCFEGDSFRNVIHLQAGKAHYECNIESVYRITGEGIWTSYNKFQQNTFNAKFFLTIFLYLDNIHPNFFVATCWIYCKSNLELLNNLLQQEREEQLNNEDLTDFYELLSECLKYKNIFLPSDNELAHSFLFYLPSRIIGGYEFLFIRLAAFLSDKMGFEVYYVDYNDGFARTQLANTKIKFINYTEQNMLIDLDCPINLIAPITMSYEIPVLKSLGSKLIFWCAHPKSIEWLSYRSGLKDSALNDFLLKLSNSASICFMDWACWNNTKNTSPIKFKEIYVPVFANETGYPPIKDIHNLSDEINIGWLGRLDEDKIFSLINLIDNLYNLQTEKKKNIHIIGDGNAKHLINTKKYSDKLNLIFASTLINDKLQQYLLSKIDILFAMGISALEAASLQIPSVVVFLSDESTDSTDFLWLFDSQKYTLGYYKEQKDKANLKITPFQEIINEIYTFNRKEDLGLKCYNYFMKNHNINVTIGKLLWFILNNVHSMPNLKIKAYSKILKFIYKVIYSTRVGRLLLSLRAKLLTRKIM